MNIIQRAKAPTPKFFRILRNVGATLAALSATVATAPLALPAAVVTAATYLGVAGGVATAVSQVAVAKEEGEGEDDDERWNELERFLDDDDDDA
jgi:hypothetical protein